jgi:hypothetical protein
MAEGNFSFEQKEEENIKDLYRGKWAELLLDRQELPVGGSIFSEELTTKLSLDFSSFEEDLENFTREKIDEGFQKSKEGIKAWLIEAGSAIDPFIFFIALNVLRRVEKSLDISSNEDNPNLYERRQMYSSDAIPNLSSFKGKSACAERAALGQYILQKIGISSAYMSGISMVDPEDIDSAPEDHSFIVLKPENGGNSIIFDIARPRSGNNLPRLLYPDINFDYDLLQNKKNILVRCKEVLQGGELYFGVGAPTFGKRNILKNE